MAFTNSTATHEQALLPMILIKKSLRALKEQTEWLKMYPCHNNAIPQITELYKTLNKARLATVKV